MSNHSFQNTEETIRPWNDRSRTRRTQEVASIASRSHLHGKTQGFRAPAFPQHKHHATSCSHYTASFNLSQCSLTLLIVLRCSTHTPPFIESRSHTLLLVMGCELSHRPALSRVSQVLLLCDINLLHHPALSIVSHFSLLCDVNSHTTIHSV